MTVKVQGQRHQSHKHSAWSKEPDLAASAIWKVRKGGKKLPSKFTKKASPKRLVAPPEYVEAVHVPGVGDDLLNRLFFGKINSHWPRVSAAYDYASWQLEQIADEDYTQGANPPNPMALVRMHHHLRSLLDPDMLHLVPDTLYPTISVDEDGDVTAEWRVVDYGLEFVTTEDGAYWVLRKGGARQTSSEDISGLRSVLSVLTMRADLINPAWRSLFPKADVQNR